mmetsp:Transcript_12215/g.45450  ORF Transcript_12215/g.45450 Transcript_12215/m.45450 type:complete len:339 (+) Transcript_12215:2254-3270(+)
MDFDTEVVRLLCKIYPSVIQKVRRMVYYEGFRVSRASWFCATGMKLRFHALSSAFGSLSFRPFAMSIFPFAKPRVTRAIPLSTTSVSIPSQSFTVSTTANTTASADMRPAVPMSTAIRKKPRGPYSTSFFKCEPKITLSARRFVLSSRWRIAFAERDSGHSFRVLSELEERDADDEVSDPSECDPARFASSAALRTVHTSRNTAVMVATPTPRNGRASSLAKYRATSTEFASPATRRNAAPSLEPINRPTTSRERFAINCLPASLSVTTPESVFVTESVEEELAADAALAAVSNTSFSKLSPLSAAAVSASGKGSPREYWLRSFIDPCAETSALCRPD